MCFDGESPKVFDENERTARKRHKCCECHMPINHGERYRDSFGVWPGLGAKHFRTCSTCVELRDRITAQEYEAGCIGVEATPPFTCLQEAINEGCYWPRPIHRYVKE